MKLVSAFFSPTLSFTYLIYPNSILFSRAPPTLPPFQLLPNSPNPHHLSSFPFSPLLSLLRLCIIVPCCPFFTMPRHLWHRLRASGAVADRISLSRTIARRVPAAARTSAQKRCMMRSSTKDHRRKTAFTTTAHRRQRRSLPPLPSRRAMTTTTSAVAGR